MTRSNMSVRGTGASIRRAVTADIDAIVRITKENGHYWTPKVDGKDALARLIARESNIILVCESDGDITGFIIGTWDGARALIHKLSVRPDLQHQGVGRELVLQAISKFKDMGAPTVGVTAAEGAEGDIDDSTGFWQKIGFRTIPARLMINFDIWSDDDEDQ